VWQPLKAVLGRDSVPAERQSVEIWRAATAERGGNITLELGGEIVAYACSIASSSETATAAIAAYRREVLATKNVGMVVDIASRALARASYARTGSDGFAAELFAEVASYYASRDLPGVVADRGRVSNISESIMLKDEIRAIARGAVERTGPAPSEPAAWRSYVSAAIDELTGGQGK
jgi:hypothetical protein